MKVITFSRIFPKGHPKEGQPTHFVEKIWKSLWDEYRGSNSPLYPYWQRYDAIFPFKGDVLENIHQHQPKHHTIRAGSRLKTSDMVSLRVWSDKPYRSKQVEFAQVEVKNVWPFGLHQVGNEILWKLPGVGSGAMNSLSKGLEIIATNDGLSVDDFISWFAIYHKKSGERFEGQIISWSDKIEY